MKTALENFIDHLNTVMEPAITIRAKTGRKYIKLIEVENGRDCSAYCFVNAENGDILKADSWSKPAPHARGNINDPETYASADQYGGWLYMYG